MPPAFRRPNANSTRPPHRQTAFHLCERCRRPWSSPQDARPHRQSRRTIDPPPFHRNRRFTAALYASLVEHLERTGHLRSRPFDAAACPDATLADISDEQNKMVSRHGRVVNGNTRSTKTHRLPGAGPSQSARRRSTDSRRHPAFWQTTPTFPAHFRGQVHALPRHGSRKPIPSYQIYKGTVFELVDQAVDFVMSKIYRAVGTRARHRHRSTTNCPH